MNHKNRIVVMLSVLTLLLSVVGASVFAQTTVTPIDPFTDGQCVAGLPSLCHSGDVTAPVVPGSDILGGERDVQLTLLNNPLASVRMPGDGRMHYANGPGTQSTALLVWDGGDGSETTIDYTGLGGLNLDQLCGPGSGSWILVFDQQYLDQGVEYTVRLYSDGDNHSRWSSGLVQGDGRGRGTARSFALRSADFVAAGGSGADLTHVGAITLLADASQDSAVDLTLGAVRVECMPPTAVDLVSFEVVRDRSGVVLTWETATEVDNLGFNLYRASEWDGPLTHLNDNLIPAHTPGSSVGGVYRFADGTAGWGPGLYWLEDVDVYGVTTLHGPVYLESLALTLMRVLPGH